MKWLVGLVAALAPSQEPASQVVEPEYVRQLRADVRAWTRADPPSAEDIRAVLDEAEHLDSASELVRELGNLGHRLGQIGREEEGRALVEWTSARAGHDGDLATEAWALDWLGQEAWSHGRLDAAAELLSSAAEVDARLGSALAQTGHLADVARIRLTQGRFDDAWPEIERAEELARAAGSNKAQRTAAEVHGSLLFELGRHREALALCLEHVPEAGQEAPRDEIQVRLEILAADVLADVGRVESALFHARRAHELALDPAVARVAPLLQLEARLSLGLLLGDLGHCDEALALLERAASEFERLGDERGAAWAAKNRGFALFRAGRWAESVPAFEAAWRAGAKLAVPFLEGMGALGVAEALALGTNGTPVDEARASAALAVAERVAVEQHERTLEWRVAALHGRILLIHGDYQEALRELRRAVVLIERWRRRLGASGLVEHALRQRSDPYRDAAFAAAHLGRHGEALAFAELLQARVLDELCARREGPLPELATPALEALREHITRLEHRLRQGVPGSGATRNELERALEQAEDELDSTLLADELSSGRSLASLDEREPVQRIAKALARQGLDAALIYLVGPDETLLWQIHGGADASPEPRIAGQLLKVDQARLEEWIERLRLPLARLEAGEIDLAHLGFDVEAARGLHDALVRPLGLVAGARLALVTDGVIGAIPFELLVTSGEPSTVDFARPFAHLRGLHYLGDEHEFASFGSLARLAHPRDARTGDALILLAPAALGLPHAAEEAAAIARALGGARIVPDTTPERVAEVVRGAARVHFAAHGRIDPERPAHGHLVLGDGTLGTSARLESWQAAELELDGAQVVLSACHSGSGKWLAGAGLAGLARGFLLAGAREVVASRWAVDDRVTARFMELFYTELAREDDTLAALRRARTRLRAEEDPRGFCLAHPAFWAAWSVHR